MAGSRRSQRHYGDEDKQFTENIVRLRFMIRRRFFHWLGLLSFWVSWNSPAQPAPLETLQNTALSVPAAALTTNGIAGLTNTAPHLMVLGVSGQSAQGGSVALVNAQAWANRFDDPLYSERSGTAVAVDSAGDVIVAGSAAHYLTGYDMLAIKYAGDGTALWTNFYNGPGNGDDFGWWVRVDAADNVYAAASSANADTGHGIAIVKYSSAGTPLWTNFYNSASTNRDYPTSFAVDASGNSYVLVMTYSDSPPAFVTLKYDGLGEAIWTNVYRGPAGGADYPEALALDGAGNIFVTGGEEGNPGYSEEMATIKYTPNGVAVWTNRYGGDLVDQPAAITADRAGNVLVTGDALDTSFHEYVTVKYSNEGVPLWTNLLEGPVYQGGSVPEVVADVNNNVFITGGTPGSEGTNADFTIVKLTGAGVPVWTNRFFDLSTGNDAPAGSAVDAAGNYYLACHSTGAAETNMDYVTLEYSGKGVALWTNRYNDPTHDRDYPEAIATDGAGNVYVTGQSAAMYGDPDVATVKYSDYVVYTPPANFVGTDTIAFSVVDVLGNIASGTVTVVVLPPALQFNTGPPNLTLTAQGLRLEVDGARGSNQVVLVASSNLIDWQPILTNSPVLGTALFLDVTATNSSQRFYRACQLP